MRPPDPADPGRAPWTELRGAARSSAYDSRWERLAAAGADVHGEADLVTHLVRAGAGRGTGPATVLDGGCGTGRVAVELARRGLRTIGVDRDPDLLAAARAKGPELTWVEADLADLGDHVAPASVDLVVLAGNVLIFVDPGTEARVVAATSRVLVPGGLLVAGFQVRPGGYDPEALDRDAAAAGLDPVDRWSTWDRSPWAPGEDYQVSVHVQGA